MLAMQKHQSFRSSLENKIVNLLLLLSKDIPTSSPVVSSEKINQLRLRKAKSAFREIYAMSLDKLLANQNAEDAKQKVTCDGLFELILCYIIFEFFISDMAFALDKIDQLKMDMNMTGFQTEKLANLRIFLCKHNFTVTKSRLSDLHEAVWDSVTRFPEEQMFYSQLMEMEGKSFFNSLKIRRFSHQALQNASSISPWLFAILYEEMKHEAMQKAFRINDLGVCDLVADNRNEVSVFLVSVLVLPELDTIGFVYFSVFSKKIYLSYINLITS